MQQRALAYRDSSAAVLLELAADVVCACADSTHRFWGHLLLESPEIIAGPSILGHIASVRASQRVARGHSGGQGVFPGRPGGGNLRLPQSRSVSRDRAGGSSVVFLVFGHLLCNELGPAAGLVFRRPTSGQRKTECGRTAGHHHLSVDAVLASPVVRSDYGSFGPGCERREQSVPDPRRAPGILQRARCAATGSRGGTREVPERHVRL